MDRNKLLQVGWSREKNGMKTDAFPERHVKIGAVNPHSDKLILPQHRPTARCSFRSSMAFTTSFGGLATIVFWMKGPDVRIRIATPYVSPGVTLISNGIRLWARLRIRLLRWFYLRMVE